MKPAARFGDAQACGMPGHHVGPIGGPAALSVVIGTQPAAVVGDLCSCTAQIAMGSMSVVLEGRLAARMGDLTSHGGAIVAGEPTVLIGD